MIICPNCESDHFEVYVSLFNNDFFECLDCGVEWYMPAAGDDTESSVVDEILRDENGGQI